MKIAQHRRRTALLMLFVSVPCAELAVAEWVVAPDASAVTMYATKQGAWFDGVFTEFTAAVDFDLKSPAAGSIAGTVKTASIATEDTQNKAYILQYLEVEQFPEARFESTSIQPIPEAFQATGELTLLGVTQPIALQFTFEPAGDDPDQATRATFIGQMTIDRFEYGIANDIDTTQAGRHITVQIELELELKLDR